MKTKYLFLLISLFVWGSYSHAQGTAEGVSLTIERTAFYGLKTTEGITMPSSLVLIGNNSFENLSSPYLDFTQCVNLEQIKNRAFYNTQLSCYNVLDFSNCHKLICVDVNADGGFDGFSGRVILPEHLAIILRPTVIEANAFLGMKLTEDPTIDLSKLFRLNVLKNGTFLNSNIEEIILPDSLKQIGANAFAGCKNLSKITVYNPVPPALGTTVFTGVDTDLCELAIPAGSHELYIAADQWKDFLLRPTTDLPEQRFVITNELNSLELKLYPNPVEDILYLNQTVDKIEVYSATGSIVKSTKTTSSIDINELSPGIYIVKLSISGKTDTRKIVKK